jgi:hypothetical protein
MEGVGTMKNWIFWTLLAICSLTIYGIGQYGRALELFPLVPMQVKEIVGHVLLYFCLGLLIARYVSGVFGVKSALLIFIVIDICAAFGIYDEFHQSFVQGRSVQVSDVILDMCGGALGALVILALYKLKRHDELGSAQEDNPKGKAIRQAVIALHLFVFIFLPAAVYSGRISEFATDLAKKLPVVEKRSVAVPQADRDVVKTVQVAKNAPASQLSIRETPKKDDLAELKANKKLSDFARVAEMLSKRRAGEKARLMNNEPAAKRME